MDLRKLMLMLNSEPVLLTLERPVSASITDNLITLVSKPIAESYATLLTLTEILLIENSLVRMFLLCAFGELDIG